MLSPGEFIPLFERNGFIYQLDRFVWEQACVLLHRWQEAGYPPLPVSVNVSRADVCQPDLVDFIRKIKELGLLVKLDTNGYRPGVLQGLLKEKLLDYVAMDLKNSREKYALTVGKPDLEIEKLEESVDLLLHSGIVYEFRTTVVKGLHEEEDFAKMGQWIEGAEAYYLQSYRDNENVIKKGYSAFEKEELESFLQLVKPYVKKAELRGVE